MYIYQRTNKNDTRAYENINEILTGQVNNYTAASSFKKESYIDCNRFKYTIIS